MADEKISGLPPFAGTPAGSDLIETVIGGVNYKERRDKLLEGMATETYVDDAVAGATGAVDSVNGQTGVVVLDQDDIADGTTNKSYTATEQTKLAGIASGANVGVVPNAAITGATKTKITYDSKGLVTAGTDATTADISDSSNKRYVTDANLVVIGNTSGTNTGDNAANTTANTYADAKVADAINDGTTTIAPSQNAVFDALATKQPLDSDLTAIAALTTTTFGRDFNTVVDAAAARSKIGAGTGSGDALVANPLSQFAATTSLQLKNTISDETGSGALVFADTPTFAGTPVFASTGFTITSGSTANVLQGNGVAVSKSTLVSSTATNAITNSNTAIVTGDPVTTIAGKAQGQINALTAYVAKTTTYTAAATDNFIDCTSGTFTVTLPTAVGITGKAFIIKNSGAGTITVATTSSQTIDGVTTKTLNTIYGGLEVRSDGANWKVTGTF